MVKKILLTLLVGLCGMTLNAQTNAKLAQRQKAIQGTYMMTFMPDTREYGKYVITADKITRYNWDDARRGWVVEYSAPYKLVYRSKAGYMTGYNIVVKGQYGTEYFCTGDTDGDGKMDIWQSDSFYYTKL